MVCVSPPSIHPATEAPTGAGCLTWELGTVQGKIHEQKTNPPFLTQIDDMAPPAKRWLPGDMPSAPLQAPPLYHRQATAVIPQGQRSAPGS